MVEYELLDTFPSFRSYWRRARRWPVGRQIDAWSQEYLAAFPELLTKQISSYQTDGIDWKTVARRRIFPSLDERFAGMVRVRRALRGSIPTAVQRCRDRLGLDFPITFVIHVGIGCGAGWATTFEEKPAVLFGLENAAELGWTDRTTVVALIEHEIAHLLHERWRREARLGGLEDHRGPWWQLYEEGFATRCELLLGPPGRHHSTEQTRDWLSWCREHRSRLASLYLRAGSSRRSWRRFFGSWRNVDGYVDTGYFLGSEVIREWHSHVSLREIAVWTTDQIRRRSRASLRRMAAEVP